MIKSRVIGFIGIVSKFGRRYVHMGYLQDRSHVSARKTSDAEHVGFMRDDMDAY
ncbi:hypothetical protein [Methanosarcina sp. KYL-1]|uniref:hypothetical protein n=1 Tax=Methanosarcina sp. KYL-1 TaxID=2602068 RepID=UPI0021016F68|nr:hypothetical protein [Methanosarcina sp. KYL-1]